MAASAGNAVGTAAGVMKYFEGRKMQREAQKAIDNFEWKDLTNAYEGVQVSTRGSDIRMDKAMTDTQSMTEALRASGTRGIVGGVGQVASYGQQVAQEVGANLDAQQKTIDFARAGDEGVIRGMNETRQTNELAGYGQQLNVGMGMKYQGMGDVQATGQAQSQHNMELFQTFGSSAMGGGGGMGGGK